MEGVSYSVSLKNELKKKEFIDYFVRKFENINIDGQVFEIALVLCKSAEDVFATTRTKRKMGQIKKDTVISCLKRLNHTTTHNDNFYNQIIESIVQNHDLKPSPMWYRVFRLCKKSLLFYAKK